MYRCGPQGKTEFNNDYTNKFDCRIYRKTNNTHRDNYYHK